MRVKCSSSVNAGRAMNDGHDSAAVKPVKITKVKTELCRLEFCQIFKPMQDSRRRTATKVRSFTFPCVLLQSTHVDAANKAVDSRPSAVACLSKAALDLHCAATSWLGQHALLAHRACLEAADHSQAPRPEAGPVASMPEPKSSALSSDLAETACRPAQQAAGECGAATCPFLMSKL